MRDFRPEEQFKSPLISFGALQAALGDVYGLGVNTYGRANLWVMDVVPRCPMLKRAWSEGVSIKNTDRHSQPWTWGGLLHVKASKCAGTRPLA
jgi:hypothetical protein